MIRDATWFILGFFLAVAVGLLLAHAVTAQPDPCLVYPAAPGCPPAEEPEPEPAPITEDPSWLDYLTPGTLIAAGAGASARPVYRKIRHRTGGDE